MDMARPDQMSLRSVLCVKHRLDERQGVCARKVDGQGSLSSIKYKWIVKPTDTQQKERLCPEEQSQRVRHLSSDEVCSFYCDLV